MSEIRYWHREKHKLCTELVLGESQVKWFHQNSFGKILTHTLLTQNCLSRVYGFFQNRPASARKIPAFISKFKIDMSEYEQRAYTSFNDFFIRKFKPGLRPFAESMDLLCAPAEARYLAFEKISEETIFPIKGMVLNFPQLLNFHPLAERFRGGPAMIARLCPTDYHRFHYPDDGEILESLRAGTKLYSVNPVALQMKGDILETNERVISFLQTKNFGLLAYVEVGAVLVGKIVQSHQEKRFLRGEEKGYFLFGGSTVILVGEKGRWLPDQDLLAQTDQGIETWCKLGTPVGHKL